MAESFDAFRYIGYLRSRWRFIAAGAAVALGAAVAVSVLAVRQYTAVARVMIEPPAGSDLRSAMALSPIYLESLRTYEHFAASDSLFQKAGERFALRKLTGPRPVESIKRRVLKVGIVRNTRILEIAATLPDPRTAQAVAQFLAESTVTLNRSMASESDQELIRGMEGQQRDARAELDRIESAWGKLLTSEPVDDLQAALARAAELRSLIQQQILSSELEVADVGERARQTSGAGQARYREQESNAKARLEEMRKQLAAVERQNAEREKVLAARMARRDTLGAGRKAGQTSLAAIEARLREARGESGYRGERLRIVDPGVVPESPSSPNLPLNVAAALLLGLALPVLYLTLAMTYQEQRAGSRRSVFQKVANARDE